MRSSFSLSLLYHAYVYLEFLILACTIYILAPMTFYYVERVKTGTKGYANTQYIQILEYVR